jgi:hypothetical protein
MAPEGIRPQQAVDAYEQALLKGKRLGTDILIKLHQGAKSWLRNITRQADLRTP